MNELRFGWFKDRHADNINPMLVPRGNGAGADHGGRAGDTWGSSADLPRLDPSENRFEMADTLDRGHRTAHVESGVQRW